MLQIAFHPDYVFDVPENHRFPMEKYDLLPKQLLYEGTVNESHFFQPNTIQLEEVLNVHHSEYVSNLTELKLSPREQRKTGFIHNHELIQRELRIMEGTRMAAELALTHGAGMNIAGGTHHAFTNRGEGFCLLNDQVIAANWILANSSIQKILIIDLDVHQGNGTAEMLANNPSIFTFSMHGKNNYPLNKEKSDLDIELDDGTNGKEYLYQLEKNISNVISDFTPDFIFYQSGVDVLSCDKLGKMALSISDTKKRDEFVFNLTKELNIPIVCSMGGGYSTYLNRIIEAHANTFRSIQNILF